ncbi:hypothetical protein RQM47_15900 [Rubrivirga sp. S365]|uniref:DUF6166 domain-containing protein n=1 Tax=Rubrivirga sp. S365 TaxID=3076080 RepID=UPI0028C8C085|nr:DUF6166 domain-containing protein [Rubrivirga sp. S365]MDT7858131.1 hypothetical protein [Rubrivirga sp. S365]
MSHAPSPAVPAATDTLALRLFGAPALPTPPPLTDQAARWADHVLATESLPPAYVVRKALDAVAFSLANGLRELSVPSKLVGTSRHPHAVEALTLGDRRPIEARPRLTVPHPARHGGAGLAVYAVRSDRSLQPVGRVQPKHAAWLTPLLRAGAAVHLLRVTGLGRRAQGLPTTLGVNVRVVVWPALDARPCTAAEPPVGYETDGGGERTPALAVRLWRDADGTARMTAVGDGEANCPHVVRHSPSGPEWGYGGSGPADCARSVLLTLTDEATADRHYQNFKAEVIALLPEHGAVIQRTVVLAWLAGRTEAVTQRAA